ncbi:hypothetical protein MACH17_33370 [Phaeobacter inhibens]|nr:hypothetical protein MACH17_33370 [Phaeobacter inhibens]
MVAGKIGQLVCAGQHIQCKGCHQPVAKWSAQVRLARDCGHTVPAFNGLLHRGTANISGRPKKKNIHLNLIS